ncbi:hypothetical protein ENUP19_0364G0072 [Entamoeba nuttalli]|uniref:Ras family GTPase n=2 Tax=Entamoeba nuttalli TaxID=412467 RepID=K2GHE7_ENTNP|nr:Ras family GTPase [Entamoeba nuttalli P19]EKE42111.1 Ras family GTPase [Entamoeba nuttalli P19]|eukprot:XP_008855560.1 Ras family GTPase [Entamoeba nuttalli P19]
MKKLTSTINIVVFGSSAVGKTALIYRYINSSFITQYEPSIDNLERCTKIINDVICTVNIQDTCGSDRFETLRELYVRSSDGALLVCNGNNQYTLTELPNFYEVIREFKSEEEYVVVVVINKIDLDLKIDIEEVNKFAESINAPCIQTSAKTNKNVDKAFSILLQRILEKNPPKTPRKCSIL